ncbi:hypothetical protein ACH5RR_040284 [Cinchona calisaya]|uniref:Phorbol-ester/DAG-type domain-containing protein n=1 Tax=Cinchona calisaya TaxID=153742 RepID=A0ABD2XVI3_9GENT
MVKAKHLIHFSHSHTLTLYVAETDTNRIPPGWELSKCHLCSREAIDSIYGCKQCGLFIHDDCAKLRQFLTHPFHPQHVLTLYQYDYHIPAANASSSESEKKLLSCSACGKTCSNFIYHCAECKFYLGDYCMQIKPQSTGICHQIPENSQPHSLFICDTPSTAVNCSFCKKSLYNEKVYVCVHCKTSLDKSCYHLPRQIRHPFHSEHPMFLLRKSWGSFWGKPLKCNACSWSSDYGLEEYYYHCSECKFTLHDKCASLSPTSIKTKPSGELQIQPLSLSHSHPLIQCDKTTELVKSSCYGCDTRLEDSVFVCLECGILLDKACTELLPEISHPFHPLHPLILVEDIQKKNRFICRGCKRMSALFTYVCRKCDFYLDPRCAMIKPNMIKSKVHQHPLAFIKTKLSTSYDFSCNTCGGAFLNNFFQCVECEFGHHLECYPLLPQVIKHNCHCDPLRLTYSQIDENSDEDSDEEFYCSACEEIRDPRDPTYCCKKCLFVAHLNCVLPEIIRCIETESAKMELGTSLTTAIEEDGRDEDEEENEKEDEEEEKAKTDSTWATSKMAKELKAAIKNKIAEAGFTAKLGHKKNVTTPHEELVKETRALADEDLVTAEAAQQEIEIVQEKVAARDEDINIKKKVATSDEVVVKENFTTKDEEDMNRKKDSPPHKEIVGENINAEDELKNKISPRIEEMDKEKVIAQQESGIKKEVAAPYENTVKENVTVPDKDTIETKIATINGEIAALQIKLEELKGRRKQFLHSQCSVNKIIKHVIRKILAMDV